MKPLKNILVATDFSPDSRAALEEAVNLGEKFRSTVYVLHAVDEIQPCVADACITEAQLEGAKSELLGNAQRKLNAEIRRFRGRKGVTLVADLRYGRTYDEIIREETEKNIDLLVMGPHAKKTYWQRMSTHLSDKVAKSLPGDVLFVHQSI